MASVRSLPVVQNWTCHGCSDCCRIEAVITDEEKQRIEALGLGDDPQIGAKPWFASVGWGSTNWKLAHRPDGACVFLTVQNRCRLQERFGPNAKPFVCRLFPFVLIPADKQWRVGLRFSCPPIAANQGRSLAEQGKELQVLARQLEQHVGRSADSAPPPELQPRQQLAWPDLLRIVEVLLEIVQDRRDRLERRLRRCLALARACESIRLAGLSGKALTDQLQSTRNRIEAEVPGDPATVPPPDALIGRVLFRLLLAVCARRDRRTAQGMGGRLARVRAGWRFARGCGPVPRVNRFLPETTFEEVEQRRGLPVEMDEILERYYLVKIASLQFCGPPNFNLPFWAGLESLILMLPMVLWLQAAGLQVSEALQIVDDHFGGDPMLNLPHFRFFQRTLAQHGQIERLVAWYGRGVDYQRFNISRAEL